MTKMQIPNDMPAEKVQAIADLVRAYNGSGSGSRGVNAMWLFLTVLLLLVFRCKDVTLWSLQERRCTPVEAAP